MPDVYELYETRAHIRDKSFVHAHVPDLDTSKLLRSLFKDKSVAEALRMKCGFSTKFGKWIPVEVADV
jgi:hypothetical protein